KEDEELHVLQRERKRRVEAAEAFRGGGREEQAAKEERELDIIQEFMPEPIDEDELKAAMRARDQERTGVLRLTLASLRAAEKEVQRPLKEDEELHVLQRERKRRVEAAEAFRGGGREEQAAKEERELEIIQEFLPEPIEEAELERIIDDAIAETGATSLRDLGRVMADVMPQVAGRADGSVVSQLVREKLA
ncbi:MAG TPA: GatB/YqeY domain-containing protein, partial [Gaiellaceae bacterium]